VAWVTLALAASALADEPVFPYEVHSRTLPNGLTVHVVPMPSPGVVAYYTWMKVGSRDEVDAGKTGFAHFFEHLLFYGSEQLGGDAREKAVQRLGADENAWTWFDETVFHGVIPASKLPDYVAIEADRFQHLHLTPDDVRKESGAVYGEFRKGQADPGNQVDVAVQQTAFRVHPYHHDTIGVEPDIKAMPGAYDYAMSFFDRYYRPENATILVVGDANPDDVFALVDKDYGGWARGKAPLPAIPVEPEPQGPRHVEIPWDAPTAARLSMDWRIPPYHPADPETASLRLLADWLLSPTGALEQRLVRGAQLAYDVSGGADESVDPGLFRITVELQHPADLGAVEAIVREEVAAVQHGVDADALARTRSHELYAFRTGLSDPGAVADALGRSLRRDPDPASLEKFWANYAATTPERVSAAARRWLVDARLTEVTLTPPKESP
jgi:zinc protease